MNREPSAHSMTVEPIEHVEDIAAELFKLRQWKAEAVVTIGRLEGERDEAVANEKAARAEIIRLGAAIDAITAERDALLRTGFDSVSNPGLVKACDDYRQRADRLQAMCHALVDAV